MHHVRSGGPLKGQEVEGERCVGVCYHPSPDVAGSVVWLIMCRGTRKCPHLSDNDVYSLRCSKCAL